ncbi:TetR/AcrR family transcriptional regulator [Catenulispora rubra]|uniref:TetR/AcrR family transcriptional regulator n=1 Tax=Catenulispora rubra TaxID=280293 RepID=UPI001892751D|nr:TetR/AcrR family transcriptional regulator [Catenulispora rubra]
MPKLWNETIEEHRAAVREAILETAAALAHEHGLTSVTMSQIATEAGIGRPTLYKYFPDVESILLAWHEQKINTHLRQLTEVRDHTEDPDRRLEAVLQTYAENAFGRHDADLGALLHRGGHLDAAQKHLRDLITELVAVGARNGSLRDDVAPAELASFCLHALTAAGGLTSKAAVRRLVQVTLAGLRPQA